MTTGTARGWYASTDNEVAITESTFGQGKTVFCGYPAGLQYFASCPYDMACGFTVSRLASTEADTLAFETWCAREMKKLGVTADVDVPQALMLRTQVADSMDRYQVFRQGPDYRAMAYEREQPGRTFITHLRTRAGIDNAYGVVHNTEAEYRNFRGDYRMTLTGGRATVRLAPAIVGGAPDQAVVYDVRLGVPVRVAASAEGAEFQTWVPVSMASVFAVAPRGAVRLFGDPPKAGEGPTEVSARVAACARGAGLQPL